MVGLLIHLVSKTNAELAQGIRALQLDPSVARTPLALTHHRHNDLIRASSAVGEHIGPGFIKRVPEQHGLHKGHAIRLHVSGHALLRHQAGG